MAQRTDILKNGYKILQDDKAFCFGADAQLLAAFCAPKIKKGFSVLDLGTGNGIIPLLLAGFSANLKSAHNAPECLFTGLEIQKSGAEMARKSVELNGLENQIKIVEGDIKNARNLFPKNSFDMVLCNPPYMVPQAAKENATDEKTIARHEVLCTLKDVAEAAAWCLKSNGAFYMIHRPYRLTEIFAALEKVHLTPRRMELVYPNLQSAPEMVLLEARPNYKPDLKIEPPLIMYNGKEYTEQMKNYIAAFCN